VILLKVLVSNGHNPYFNQALESHIFYHTDDFVLMLYINAPCLVIGRNQNPWKEINMNNLDIPLVRRLSGGGTVYHDRGNVNFSFIYSEGDTTVEKNFEYIRHRLSMFGINLEVNARNDLMYKENKVSGNAFYRRGKRRLHHGTLLVDVDTKDLWHYLNFDHEKFKCKSVPSKKSPIINLKEVVPYMTSKDVIDLLKYDLEHYMLDFDVSTLDTDQYKSPTWILEETPKFQYQYMGLIIDVVKGYIKSDLNSIDNKMFSETLIKKEVEHVSRII
jgi:lipoate-protein ligase A